MLGYGVTIPQRTIVHINYFHRVFAVLRHWIPGSLIDSMVAISSMAECESDGNKQHSDGT